MSLPVIKTHLPHLSSEGKVDGSAEFGFGFGFEYFELFPLATPAAALLNYPKHCFLDFIFLYPVPSGIMFTSRASL